MLQTDWCEERTLLTQAAPLELLFAQDPPGTIKRPVPSSLAVHADDNGCDTGCM